MIKTHYRDYATEAFRILALEGSAEKFRERIWNEALDNMERRKERNGSISAPTEAAIMRAQKALDDAKATILDLEAAEFALEALEKYGALKGSYLSVRRLLRCNPFYKGDPYDPVP